MKLEYLLSLLQEISNISEDKSSITRSSKYYSELILLEIS
jgi:hypothetical protein